MRHRTNLIADYEREVKRGRGSGSGSLYRPWLTASDVTHSTGMRYRIFLRRFGRLMHVLSRSELLTLLKFDWDCEVTEVYEQYPLDPAVTCSIAESLNVRHPGYSFGGTVMTTDFFVRRRVGMKFRSEAFQVKSSRSDTEISRAREKLLIEQTYWEQRNVDWQVLYACDFNPIECSNLERLAQWRNMRISRADLKELEGCFLDLSSACPEANCTDLRSVSLTLPSGFELNAFNGVLLLAANKRILFPIDKMPLEKGLLQDYRIPDA